MQNSLSAFELPTSVEFPVSLCEKLTRDKRSARVSKYSIFTWTESSIWTDPQHGSVANGFEIGRLGKGHRGNRYYIIPRIESLIENSNALNNEAKRQISDRGSRMSGFSISKRFDGIELILSELRTQYGDRFQRLDESCSFKSVSDCKQILFTEHDDGSLQRPDRLWTLFATKGPLRKPTKSKILVYSDTIEPRQIEIISSRLKNSLSKLSPLTEVEATSFKDATEILENSKKEENIIGYIGVSGGPGTPISDLVSSHMKKLDMLRRSYRAFGTKTLSERYALNDQVTHLIELLGGQSYRLKPVRGFENVTYIGFDLGHPKSRQFSIPVMTIVNSKGALLGYWKGKQSRDETLTSQTIVEATKWLKSVRLKLNLTDEWIVIRDGKSFQNDGIKHLIEYLGGKTAYIEVIKNPVPLVAQFQMLASPGTLATWDDSNEAILQTETPLVHHQVGRPVRLKVKQNSLGRSIESLAAAVFSLCHAPSLGLRSTRLPSPIYWADGLAKECGRSIQFSGIHHALNNEQRLDL
ncbi:hypothetical protein N9M57_04810 [Opitutales bacterium]|nr:hypothetical protein [Opitutales bacterium]